MTVAEVVMPAIFLFIACDSAGTLKEKFEVSNGGWHSRSKRQGLSLEGNECMRNNRETPDLIISKLSILLSLSSFALLCIERVYTKEM